MNKIIPNHLLVKLALKNSTLSTLVATFLQWRAQVLLVSIISKDHYMLHNMVFYPTIARHYFVKTQTYVALFGPHELSLIFSGGMCLELTSL